jgi:hypothetical protein
MPLVFACCQSSGLALRALGTTAPRKSELRAKPRASRLAYQAVRVIMTPGPGGQPGRVKRHSSPPPTSYLPTSRLGIQSRKRGNGWPVDWAALFVLTTRAGIESLSFLHCTSYPQPCRQVAMTARPHSRMMLFRAGIAIQAHSGRDQPGLAPTGTLPRCSSPRCGTGPSHTLPGGSATYSTPSFTACAHTADLHSHTSCSTQLGAAYHKLLLPSWCRNAGDVY